MEKLKVFFSNRTNLILLGILLLIIIGAIFGASKLLTAPKGPEQIEEVDLPFDPEGPYALLVPRRDGHAVNLIIKRVISYDSFSYQIEYTDEEGIDRGAGDPNTWIKVDKEKAEFDQLILFGTCSQGYTSGGAHCVFDKSVENGSLLLKIRKGNLAYRTKITWHLQEPDVALGKISSGDGHFNYKTNAPRDELVTVAWTLVNDLSGVPKLPEGKEVLGKVYAFNLPTAKTFPKGDVNVELAENPPSDAQIARYVESKNGWDLLETKIDGSTLSAKAEGAGIFAILINSAK